MKFADFVENSYAQASADCGKQYDLRKDGIAKASIALIGFLRGFYKYLGIPTILFNFLAYKLGLKEAPTNPLKELLKKQQDAKSESATDGKPVQLTVV